MSKKNKPKETKGYAYEDLSTKRSLLGKIGLALIVGIVILSIGYGAYTYITLKQENTRKVQLEQKNSSDELMRKMKQMLDDEKMRLSALPEPPKQETHSEPVEENTTKQSASDEVASAAAPLIPHEDDNKINVLSEVHEYQSSLKEAKVSQHKPSEVIRKKYPPGTTPKLAIIIDDVSFPWQTRLMKEIPYKVTPAFFPPASGHPETVRLSHEFPFAMVHLPLEAKYYSRPEEETLNTTDSYEKIEKRIKRIKAWFPHITYYNNHTGGYFTAHYEAMDKLVGIMKENNLSFVDSRTIGNSKAPEVTKKHGMFLYSRDVFLDNSLNKPEIRAQLQLAVSKAKKNGYAIAIGHPHKNTLEVLRDSSELLQGVEMVYLNEL